MMAFPAKHWTWSGIVALVAALVWMLARSRPTPPPASSPEKERIPPDIVVTESSSAGSSAPGIGVAAGDRILAGYANPSLPAQNDVVLMARAISSFLIIAKQATQRPLSANEEWSSALCGKRPGTDAWISQGHRALDARGRLVDRWGSPLHFHALGGKQWEVRSAGPDRKLFTDDDLMETASG